MQQEDIYLSIGTNLGDRKANIQRAIELLNQKLSCHYCKISSIVESKASGFEGPDFLDCAVKYRSDVPPLQLLSICKDIEWEMGRRESVEFRPDGSRVYHDRIIDIDILLYGDLKLELPQLTIPHPRIKERVFILGPLSEIIG